MTSELLPLRYGLVATLESADDDRPDYAATGVRSTQPHPHGCTCGRCLKLYGKDGRP